MVAMRKMIWAGLACAAACPGGEAPGAPDGIPQESGDEPEAHAKAGEAVRDGWEAKTARDP